MNSSDHVSGQATAEEISKALDTMWAKFLPDIRERAMVLESAGQEALAGALSEEKCQAAKAAAHKLAGTLGTFGLQRGSALAQSVEALYGRGQFKRADAVKLTAMTGEIKAIIESRK